MYQFLLVFLSVIILGYFLERFLISIFGFRVFRLIIIPGVIVHEVSHALVAMCFGAQIKSLLVFKKDGGEVKYQKPYLPLISNPIIAIAPLIFCSLILYFLGIIFGFNLQVLGLNFSFADLLKIFNFQNISILKILVYLYFVLSLTASMVPSKQDFKNAMVGLIVILLVFFGIYYFFPQTNIYFLRLGYFYLIGLYLILISFIIAIFFWGLKKALFRIIGLSETQ